MNNVIAAGIYGFVPATQEDCQAYPDFHRPGVLRSAD
jgi:hypothetical protein